MAGLAMQQMMVAAPNAYYNSANFTASYQWDDEGRMTSLQYPTVSATGSFGSTPANMPIREPLGIAAGDPGAGNGADVEVYQGCRAPQPAEFPPRPVPPPHMFAHGPPHAWIVPKRW